MPIREYICQECGHVFENVELGTDDEKPICPRCNSPEVTRILSIFSSSGGGCDVSSSFG